jgi:hypothetical protein
MHARLQQCIVAQVGYGDDAGGFGANAQHNAPRWRPPSIIRYVEPCRMCQTVAIVEIKAQGHLARAIVVEALHDENGR